VAEEHGIIDYVKDSNGRVTKTSYAKGIERLTLERDDIEYDEPVPGETQALGKMGTPITVPGQGPGHRGPEFFPEHRRSL
jgi:hypothetical protein